MIQQNHIIHRLNLEVQTSSENEAYEIKDHISDFLNSEFLPRLETLMDKLGTEKQLIRFDQVDLDLKVEKWNDAPSILTQAEHQLRRKLGGIPSIGKFQRAGFNKNGNTNSNETDTNGLSVIEKSQNQEDIFFELLRSGTLSWFANKEQVTNLLIKRNWNKIIEKPSFVNHLFQVLSKDRIALHRFVNQVASENILLLLARVEVVHPSNLKELHADLEGLSPKFRRQVIMNFVNIWISGFEANKSQIDRLSQQYKKEAKYSKQVRKRSFEKWSLSFLNKKVLLRFQYHQRVQNIDTPLNDEMVERGPLDQSKKGDTESNPTIISKSIVGNEREKEPLDFTSIQNEYMVQNAGQVLFHPFIHLLFQNFGWIDGNRLLKDEFRVEAVHALHYCNTGQDTFFEPDLILEKYLCSLPFHQTIPSDSLLTRQMKREITSMLKEVIKNWPELKNTSPNGLREAFIQRSGKLIKNENGYKLIVERKVQDVLLEKLDWNISIIKMPWHKEILFVEW